MTDKKLITVHGGDLDAVSKFFGIARNEIIDFSGNINPLGLPESVKRAVAQNADVAQTYPDKNYAELKAAIAEYAKARPQNISVGNGSTELISTFINTCGDKKSLILAPAYSEYERESLLAGKEVKYFALEEQNDFNADVNALISAVTPDVDLLVICNPNNPTGTAIKTEDLRRVLSACKERNVSVMVDETYIEFADDIDEICAIPLTEEFDNLFIIRGTSKFFAAPGVRLGYGVCSSERFASALAAKQDPWSVNSFAELAGRVMFKDKAFISATKKLISYERQNMFDKLSANKNLKVYKSRSNFMLARLITDKITSGEIFDRLIRRKMLIRDASSFEFLDENYIRFCILSPENNKKLIDGLNEILS